MKGANMSKRAISAGKDKSGVWHVFDTPDTAFQTQKANLKALIAKDGKVTPLGAKKAVQLEDWCLYIQTVKRYRRGRGKSGLAGPVSSADIEL